MSARTKDCAFTLLEILIALIIFSSGVIAIVWAFNRGMFASTDVENVDLALNIAQAKMEEIKNTDFLSLSDSGPTADPNFSGFDVTVNVAEGENPMQVDVDVGWDVKGGSTSITLTTLIYSTARIPTEAPYAPSSGTLGSSVSFSWDTTVEADGAVYIWNTGSPSYNAWAYQVGTGTSHSVTWVPSLMWPAGEYTYYVQSLGTKSEECTITLSGGGPV